MRRGGDNKRNIVARIVARMYLAFRQDFTPPGGGMYSCIQAKDRAQNITYFLVHHTNARDVCSSRGEIHAFGTSHQAS